MKIKVHLLTTGGQFVGAWDCPLMYPPQVLIWGVRMFVRNGASVIKSDEDLEPLRYFEATAFTIPDAHVTAEK